MDIVVFPILDNHDFPILDNHEFPILDNHEFPILDNHRFPILDNHDFPILENPDFLILGADSRRGRKGGTSLAPRSLARPLLAPRIDEQLLRSYMDWSLTLVVFLVV